MKNSTSHPHLDFLELYLLDRLAGFEKRKVEEHLLLCGRCICMAHDLEEQIQLIRAAMPTNDSWICSLRAA